MNTTELQLRLALLALMDEFKRILNENCKDPIKNDAYRKATEVLKK